MKHRLGSVIIVGFTLLLATACSGDDDVPEGDFEDVEDVSPDSSADGEEEPDEAPEDEDAEDGGGEDPEEEEVVAEVLDDLTFVATADATCADLQQLYLAEFADLVRDNPEVEDADSWDDLPADVQTDMLALLDEYWSELLPELRGIAPTTDQQEWADILDLAEAGWVKLEADPGQWFDSSPEELNEANDRVDMVGLQECEF